MMIKSMMKFRIIFVLALMLQLVVVPLHSLAVATDTKAPTWVAPIHYLALGDSLAFGISEEGVPGKGYPDFLAQSLNEKNVLKSSNKGFSFPGYTASDVIKDLKSNVAKPIYGTGHEEETAELHKSIERADVITISIGANDVLQHFKIDPTTGLPQIDILKLGAAIQQVGTNYNEILKGIYAINPKVQVYVMGYYNPFPHLADELQPQLAQLLAGLNGAIQTGMKGTDAIFVQTSEQIATDFPAHLPNPNNIHPSEVGYKIIASAFSEQLQTTYPWIEQDTLTAEVKNNTTVKLNWKSVVDDKAVANYIIYNGKEKIGQVKGDVNTYNVENLDVNKVYTFSVVAVDRDTNTSVLNPTVTITTDSSPVTFSDIENHWAKPFIEQAVEGGIVTGYLEGTFKPNNPLTRAQAASILVRSLSLTTDKVAPFEDIKQYGQVTQAEIAAAYQFGIVKGENGKFNPNKSVTRAQLALMVKRAYELVKGEPYIANELAPYADIANYDAETKNAIALLNEFKIAEGMEGKFNPSNATTRGQAAKIFVNAYAIMR